MYSTVKKVHMHRENSCSSTDAANEFHTSHLIALSDNFGVSTPNDSTNSNKSVVNINEAP